jgi:DNA-binding NarL/FixJ family response regulator
MTVRIVLVDDHQMLRDGLRAIIDSNPALEVVGEAADGRTAIELASAFRPDVVVMDVVMPGMNGIEATHRIVSESPATKVVALSIYADKRYVAKMLEAGASAYVLKAAAHGLLLEAIRVVMRGGVYLSPEIGPLADDGRPPADSAFRSLGSREREVLQLVAEGKTSLEIAALLHIAVKTVETHRQNIMRKLGIHRLADLVKYALREGLTSLDP